MDRGRRGELVRVHGMDRCDEGNGVEDDLTEHPLSPFTFIHRYHAMASPDYPWNEIVVGLASNQQWSWNTTAWLGLPVTIRVCSPK